MQIKQLIKRFLIKHDIIFDTEAIDESYRDWEKSLENERQCFWNTVARRMKEDEDKRKEKDIMDKHILWLMDKINKRTGRIEKRLVKKRVKRL